MKGEARWRSGLLVFAVFLVTGAIEVSACPVCYGEAEGSLIEGAQASVLFMAGLTYTLLIGGVIGAVFIRKQAVKRQNPKSNLYLVEDETRSGDDGIESNGEREQNDVTSDDRVR